MAPHLLADSNGDDHESEDWTELGDVFERTVEMDGNKQFYQRAIDTESS